MPLGAVRGHAQRAERLGYDGLLVPEAVSDGTLLALLALEHTERLRVATGVVVAFARSPTLLAQDAWALQQLSGGRFALGLGSQVRGNVVERFGMPWSAPAPRMRDYVGALRAVFGCWQSGGPLHFESSSYHLSRMQPFFRPGPIEHPEIPIWLGAVGPRMTRLAGEVANRLVTHPTQSDPAMLRTVTWPALADGAERAGRRADAVSVLASPLAATGASREAVAAEREKIRELLGFLYSTPAYRAALDHHGWGEVADALHRLSRQGNWKSMSALVSDEMLDRLAPSGTFDELPGILVERYADLAQALTLRMPEDPGRDAAFARVVAALRAA